MGCRFVSGNEGVSITYRFGLLRLSLLCLYLCAYMFHLSKRYLDGAHYIKIHEFFPLSMGRKTIRQIQYTCISSVHMFILTEKQSGSVMLLWGYLIRVISAIWSLYSNNGRCKRKAYWRVCARRHRTRTKRQSLRSTPSCRCKSVYIHWRANCSPVDLVSRDARWLHSSYLHFKVLNSVWSFLYDLRNTRVQPSTYLPCQLIVSTSLWLI